MKLLVTGGLGFIGSNFIQLVLEKYPDYSIINLDKLTYCGNPNNAQEFSQNPRYSFVRGDVCNAPLVNDLISNVDVVVHFAAESHVDNSINEPFIFTKTNMLGTHVLLEAARQKKIKRFIMISTDEVYGSIREGSFKETDGLFPNSPYAASKASADVLSRSYYKTYGLPVIVTRSSNNFGAYQHPEKLIPLFITNLIQGKKVPVYGDGKNIRDWIYVLDNCEGIDFVLHHGKLGEVYNVGGGNEIPNIDITKMLLENFKLDNTFISYVEDRLGHDFRYALDCSKINNLGWNPKHDFKTALDSTIEWYKNNDHWWKYLKVK